MRQSHDFIVGKLTTLGTLAIGLSLGFISGVLYQPKTFVSAQSVSSPASQVEDVSPVMTVGSLGTNLVLAHEVDADQLVVNGYDVMAIQQGVINYLATRRGAEAADFQNIVNASRAKTLHRIKAPTPPTPTPERKQ